MRGDNSANATIDAFNRRAEALEKNVELWGCVVTLVDTPVGEVSGVARIRNVTYSETLVGEIAELMAYCKLLRLLQRERAKAG